MKKNAFVAITWFMALVAAGCSNSEETTPVSQDAAPVTRNIGVKTPKLTAYIETNDINPLNMGEYYFNGAERESAEPVLTIVRTTKEDMDF